MSENKQTSCKAHKDSTTCLADTSCAFYRETVCFQGFQWLKVKHLPNTSKTWFSGNDRLAGTLETGTQGKDDEEWSIKFETLKFDSYLIATGNF